jgi:hypothetical protein
VSKSVEHRVEIALTVLWLGGAAYLREVLQTGWSGPIILLIIVVLLEVVFLVWSRGSLTAGKDAMDNKPSEG